MLIVYGWVSAIVQKVFNGAGLEHCCTIEGVRFPLRQDSCRLL
jgi:hypothetical protein